jgi:CHASE2 domain-containing sensor protein
MAPQHHSVEAEMLVLVIVLLVAWLIVSVIGFALQGLVWLGIIGVILFIGTAAIGAVRRRSTHRKSVSR